MATEVPWLRLASQRTIVREDDLAAAGLATGPAHTTKSPPTIIAAGARARNRPTVLPNRARTSSATRDFIEPSSFPSKDVRLNTEGTNLTDVFAMDSRCALGSSPNDNTLSRTPKTMVLMPATPEGSTSHAAPTSR